MEIKFSNKFFVLGTYFIVLNMLVSFYVVANIINNILIKITYYHLRLLQAFQYQYKSIYLSKIKFYPPHGVPMMVNNNLRF